MSNGVDLFTVYSYGGGETLGYIFNSIAMLFKHKLADMLFQVMTMLGLIWAGLRSSTSQDKFKPYAKWFLSYMTVILVLIQPPSVFKDKGNMTIHVRDVITGNAKKVDNLPPGLVIPASIISGIGYSVTKVFESAFTLSDKNYLPYSEYGTMFGAQVMSELRNYKIQNTVFKENIEGYITNCMMYDVMIGKKYDIQELSHSKDILQLLINKSSNLRRFNYRVPLSRNDKGAISDSEHGGRKLLTCKDGITELAKSFSGEEGLIGKRFPTFSKIANHSTRQSEKQGFLKALDVSLKFYGSPTDTNAAEQLKQILVINAFKDKPASYGFVRSTQHQNTVWKYTGEMAQQMLPILHALFQALIYASFPFIACILFFPGGFRILGTYLGMMIWIELWCPLFAVFNLIVSVFAKAAGGISEITIEGMTNIASVQYSYAMAAMSLGMLIPTLSYMIVKGGAGQFVHVAGQMLGASTSGLSAAAQEVVTGNRTLDHISIGDKSLHNVNANKYDNTGSIVTNQERSVDPTGKKRTEHLRNTVIESGRGTTVSTASKDFTTFDTVQQNTSRSAQEAYSKAADERKEYTTAEQSREAQSVDWVAKLAEAESKGEKYALQGQVADISRINNVVNMAKELRDQHGYSWNQAADASVRAQGSVGVSVGGTGVGISAGGGLSTSKASTQNLTEASSSSLREDREKTLNTIMRVSKDANYSSSQVEERNLAEGINKAHETMQQKRENIAIHESHAKRFEKVHSRMEGMGFEEKRTEMQGLMNFIANKADADFKDHNFRIGYQKAHFLIESDSTRSKEYIQEYFDMKTPNQSMLSTPSWNPKVDIDQTGDKLNKIQISNDIHKTKESIKDTHFSKFNTDGENIKQQYEVQEQRATQRIQEQEMKLEKNTQDLKLKTPNKLEKIGVE